jgi:magnesium-transporting ATPase (P-type)
MEECEKQFRVDRNQGLSSRDVVARLRAHGPNELTEHLGPSTSTLQLIAQQSLVVHTAMATEIGKIHEVSQEDDDTPLKKKLNKFGEALTEIIGLICVLVWLPTSSTSSHLRAPRVGAQERTVLLREVHLLL